MTTMNTEETGQDDGVLSSRDFVIFGLGAGRSTLMGTTMVQKGCRLPDRPQEQGRSSERPRHDIRVDRRRYRATDSQGHRWTEHLSN